MSRANCKLCGQPLNSKQAVASVREHGATARRLTDKQRTGLRRALINREVKLRAADRDRLPGLAMATIAERYGCSRRTALRELEWLKVDGTLQAALEREGLA